MFANKGLFSEIVCPYQDICMLPRCIFKHPETKCGAAADVAVLQDDLTAGNDQEGQRKRLKVEGQTVKSATNELVKPQAPATKISKPKESPRVPAPKSILARSTDKSSALRRTISPPPLRRQTEIQKTIITTGPKDPSPSFATKPKSIVKTPVKAESLNPRLLKGHAPATHDFRWKCLRALHEHLVRLNTELEKDAKDDEEELVLSPQELITKALDIEEETTKSASVYSNLIKNKIVAYKRMGVREWVVERAKEVAARKAREAPPPVAQPIPTGPPKPIETGLTLEQELSLLPRLQTPITGLSVHGYVSSIPTTAEIEKAKAGIEAAKGWEVCDRCKSRFQVYPGRREEDGALASGGKCLYHYGKSFLEDKSTTDPKARRAKRYRCCNETLGETAGCTTAEHHVFKISEVKRMASVLNFEKTPDNPAKEGSKPVCIDGEMGYTVYGLELIRLTATSWPDGKELFDVLVRPVGPILDLNSRFSGVWPKDMAEAPSWSSTTAKPTPPKSDDKTTKRQLSIVSSPAIARSLLFSFLTPQTPLIGHGLENDLNATRIIHPTIIDTALLYPHKAGLPFRNGLKALMAQHLNRHIQVIHNGKMEGHDSKEDANAAGELVRFAVKREWEKMKRMGWGVDGEGRLSKVKESGKGRELVGMGVTKADRLKGMMREKEVGVKRSREEMEDGEVEESEKGEERMIELDD